MGVFRVGIVQVAVIQDGNFPRWGLSWVGIFLGRNFPVGVIRVGVYLVLLYHCMLMFRAKLGYLEY